MYLQTDTVFNLLGKKTQENMLHNALTDNFIFFLIQSHHTPSLKALWYLEHGQSESRAWTYQSETKKEDSLFIRNKLDFILKSNNFYSENSLFTN